MFENNNELYSGLEVRQFDCENNYQKYRDEYENDTQRKLLASAYTKGPVYFLSYKAILNLLDGSNIVIPPTGAVKGITFFQGKQDNNLVLLATPGDEESKATYPDRPERIYQNGQRGYISLADAISWVADFDRQAQHHLQIKTEDFIFTKKQLKDLIYIEDNDETEISFKLVIAPKTEQVKNPKYFSLASQNGAFCQLSHNCPPDCYDNDSERTISNKAKINGI